MFNIYTWSPYLISYCTFLIQTFIMISYVWIPQEENKERDGIGGIIYQYFRHFFFSFYFMIGFIIFDTGIFWLMGQWTYLDWRFQLPSVILGLILGFQYIIRTYFAKPTKLDLGYGIILLIALTYMIHWGLTDLWYIKKDAILLVTCAVVVILIFPIIKIVELKLNNKENKPLWNISATLNKVFNKYFNGLFWIIATIEAMCKFAGTSIFIL